jgi:hypothetical protein
MVRYCIEKYQSGLDTFIFFGSSPFHVGKLK